MKLPAILFLCLLSLSAFGQSDTVHIDNSIPRLDELNDFYFSLTQLLEQEGYIIQDGNPLIWIPDNRDGLKLYFKGKRYTVCVTHGEKVLPVMDDYVFLGTGTFSDVTFEKQ